MISAAVNWLQGGIFELISGVLLLLSILLPGIVAVPVTRRIRYGRTAAAGLLWFTLSCCMLLLLDPVTNRLDRGACASATGHECSDDEMDDRGTAE